MILFHEKIRSVVLFYNLGVLYGLSFSPDGLFCFGLVIPAIIQLFLEGLESFPGNTSEVLLFQQTFEPLLSK